MITARIDQLLRRFSQLMLMGVRPQSRTKLVIVTLPPEYVTANDGAVIPNLKKSSTAATDDVVEKLEE
jgi:hypothetical protein